jgi:hypothetical protein
MMSSLKTKNLRTGSIRMEIHLLYTLPERQRLNKRIKVIEPNVSVSGHAQR